jgi:hypothetical protein
MIEMIMSLSSLGLMKPRLGLMPRKMMKKKWFDGSEASESQQGQWNK